MQLRTRLTGLFIISAMLGIGAVLFFQSMLVRGFVSESLLDRQYSEVRYIAAEVDDEIRLRLDWVSLIASKITPETLADPTLLKRYLQDRQIATKLFNGGIFVIAANGVCVGNHPATPPGSASITRIATIFRLRWRKNGPWSANRCSVAP